MRKSNRWRIVSATLTLCLGLVGCGTQTGDTSGPVVATYSGGKVYQGELDKQYHIRHELLGEMDQAKGQSKQEFLQEYVFYHKVMVDEAKKSGVKVDPNQVNSSLTQYKDMLSQFSYGGDKKKLGDKMKELKVQDADIKMLIENSLYLEQFQKQKLAPEDKLKKTYEENKASFATATVHHVLTKTKEEAEKVKERLTKGEDFAKVAKEVSIDPSAKENGGKMEGPLSQYVPQFRDVAAKIEIGKISDPVQTEYGFHILKVEKRGESEPFEKVKQNVEELYFAANQATIEKEWKTFEDELKKKADIKITLPS
ncbi:peptidylprolyl isomerase [Effusibacillus consociatus]|uniref:Peptidylprolyl isomerase n=1 Tax=Effusibacillus consociatus TaxID=1117041 RepID=A0ABV9Q420_9BACL